MSVLLVSHDFGVIAQVCDRVAVMYGGHMVESGPLATLYEDPQHPYTRALLASVPSLHAAGRTTRRTGIAGQPPELTEVLPGCVFAPRCAHAQPVCLDHADAAGAARRGAQLRLRRAALRRGGSCGGRTVSAPVLHVAGIVKAFPLRRSVRERLSRAAAPEHRAVDDVSFDLARGEVLGLAGGSGSGKTTLARCLIRLVEPDAGHVVLDGSDVMAARGEQLRELRRRMQMVFQDPFASLNPRMTVQAALHEAGRVHRRPGSGDAEAFVRGLLDQVHLSAGTADRYPRELSGGQRQRVAVARALAVGPDVLIADEAVSALDVSVQAQLLAMFLDLRDELGLSVLFVAHQLAVIAEVCDRVAVMQDGRIVEIGPTAQTFAHPQHAYTRQLLDAHPSTEPRARTPGT